MIWIEGTGSWSALKDTIKGTEEIEVLRPYDWAAAVYDSELKQNECVWLQLSFAEALTQCTAA